MRLSARMTSMLSTIHTWRYNKSRSMLTCCPRSELLTDVAAGLPLDLQHNPRKVQRAARRDIAPFPALVSPWA